MSGRNYENVKNDTGRIKEIHSDHYLRCISYDKLDSSIRKERKYQRSNGQHIERQCMLEMHRDLQ